MSHTKTFEDLEKELNEAKKAVKIGGTYSNYKSPRNLYKVVALGTQEATEKLCVIYQSEDERKLLFVRDLDNWLDKPDVDGTKVERFKLIDKR